MVWRWRSVTWTLALGVALAIAVRLPLRALPEAVESAYWAGVLVVIGALLVRAWVWQPIAWRHLRYAVDEDGIVIERGVLWRSHVSLPRIRIQHTDVTQGPLQRRYGIAALKLYTAGSRYTEIVLPGLAYDDAARLRDALLAEATGHGV